MMKRLTRDSPFVLSPPTDTEVSNFTLHNKGGPTTENFRVDVRGKNQRSKWNQRCAQLFAASYVRSPGALETDVPTVVEAFLVHINGLSGQYQRLCQRGEGGDEDSDDENAKSEMEAAKVARLRISRRHKVSEQSMFLLTIYLRCSSLLYGAVVL